MIHSSSEEKETEIEKETQTLEMKEKSTYLDKTKKKTIPIKEKKSERSTTFFLAGKDGVYTIEEDGLYYTTFENNVKREISKDSFFTKITSICTSGDEFYAISDGGILYSINPENGNRLELATGYDNIIHITFCKGKLFVCDNYGFIFSFDILTKKAEQVIDNPLQNVRGLTASNDKVFILNSQ